MKTKHLLMAMALPVAFAACTSEEIVESTQNQDLNARKALGNVELVFGDEVNSRMTAEGGNIGFVVGDAVGACLVDNYTPVSAPTRGAVDNYTLTSSIQTNYQYKYDGSSWTTNALMVEGNYVFYAPYNKEHLSRKPITVSAPIVQNLALAEDGTVDAYSAIDEFVKSGQPAYVGYKFLAAEGQDLKVAVDMKPIYAYPLITINNNKTGQNAADMHITKVVISTTGGFPTEAPLNIGTAGSAAKAAAGGVVGYLYNVGTHHATNNPHGSWAINAKQMVGNKTSNVVGTATKTSGIVTVNMPEGLCTIPVGESVKFHVVLPAESSKAYKVYAYTADGMAFEVNGNISTSMSAGKIYPDNQYNSTTGALVSQNTAANTWTLKSNAMLYKSAPIIISSTDELIALFRDASSNVENITLANENVKLNADVMAVANSSLTYEFDSKIDVVGGTSTAPLAISNVGFSGGVNIESGYVTLDSFTENIDVTVEAGELTLVNAPVNASLAELKVGVGAKAIVGDGTNAFTGKVNLHNKGEVVISDKVTAMNFNAMDNTYVGSDSKTYNAKITNKAGWLISTITGNWVIDKDAVVDRNVTVAAGANLKNNSSLTIKNGYTLTVNGTVDNLADKLFVNNGTLTIGTTGLVEMRGLYKGNNLNIAAGRVNLYSTFQTSASFGTVSGILAEVWDTFDLTKTTADALKYSSKTNMLSVKTLKLNSTLPVSKIELAADATVTLSKNNVTTASASTITTLGAATITGLYNIGSGAGSLTIQVAEGYNLKFASANLTKGTADCTLKGTKTGSTVTSTYELTAGAAIAAGVAIDANTIKAN